MQRSGDVRALLGDCLIVSPLPNSSMEQQRMVVMVTRYTLFATSWYDVIFAFVYQRFGEVCWRNLHIILHALSLVVVVQCVTGININYISASSSETGEKHSNQRYNAAIYTVTAKISGNALKDGSRTMLSQRSSKLQSLSLRERLVE